MRFCMVLFWLAAFHAAVVQAETLKFEESYVYDAGESDSKLTCRAISLLQVKKLLLERIGAYLETKTEVVNYQLTKDQITLYTAGIVKTELIDEWWDGKTYRLLARIEADPDTIAKSIDDLRKNRQGREELSKVESINAQSLEKIESLKKETARLQQNLIDINRSYSESAKLVKVWEAYEAGMDFLMGNQYAGAVTAFSQAIEVSPTYLHYYHRGRAYMGMEEYQKAIDDFNAAISLNPALKGAYFQRGKAYRKTGARKKGLKDIEKAAELGNGQAKQWLQINKSRVF